jgi:hypothetical protein
MSNSVESLRRKIDSAGDLQSVVRTMKAQAASSMEAAAGISADVSARFDTAEKLSDEDRKAVIEIARQALAPFQPKSELEPAKKP